MKYSTVGIVRGTRHVHVSPGIEIRAVDRQSAFKWRWVPLSRSAFSSAMSQR